MMQEIKQTHYIGFDKNKTYVSPLESFICLDQLLENETTPQLLHLYIKYIHQNGALDMVDGTVQLEYLTPLKNRHLELGFYLGGRLSDICARFKKLTFSNVKDDVERIKQLSDDTIACNLFSFHQVLLAALRYELMTPTELWCYINHDDKVSDDVDENRDINGNDYGLVTSYLNGLSKKRLKKAVNDSVRKGAFDITGLPQKWVENADYHYYITLQDNPIKQDKSETKEVTAC